MNNMYKYFYRIGIILNSIGTLSALLTYIDESFIKEAKLLNPTIKNVVFFLINLSLILFLDIIIPYTLLRKSNSNKQRIKVTCMYIALLSFQTVLLALRCFLPTVKLYIMLAGLNLLNFYAEFISVYPMQGTIFLVLGNVFIISSIGQSGKSGDGSLIDKDLES